MGQTIEINNTAIIDHVLVIDTDRTLAGQDGESYNGVETARLGATFPAQLAVRLFESVSSVDHVFVMSNSVSVRRPIGWDEETVETATTAVSEFFRFYR